jgi:hypothetical protein
MHNNMDSIKYGSFASTLIYKSTNKKRITVGLPLLKI